MKFSELKREQWPELKPYLDTCLLPLSGLAGDEPPWQVTDKLAQLQEVLDVLEIPFKGRIVTYPAMHYFSPPGQFVDSVNHVCRTLKASGFAYVFVAAADPQVSVLRFADADLFITLDDCRQNTEEIAGRVRACWEKM